MRSAADRPGLHAAPRDPGHTLRFAIVFLCVLGTACIYALCVEAVLGGHVDVLFGAVPWLAAAAVAACVAVALSALAEVTHKGMRARRPALTPARVTLLAAAIGARDSADREHALEKLMKRLDVTRDVLAEVSDPAVAEQLAAGGFAARVEQELATAQNKWRRVSAAGVLGRLGLDSSLDLLERALQDVDPDIAYAAAQALSLYQSPRAYETLLGALTSRTIPAARVASLLEAFQCPEARELIEHRAASADPAMRYWAAYLLGSLADPRSAPVIVRLAQDRSEDVRANAAESLASFPNEEILRRLLDDESWVVRSHAAKAAGAGCQVAVAPRLAELLEDRSWWVRQNATIALASFGAPAVAPLLAQLHSEDRFARNKAAEALIRNGYAAEQIQRVKEGGRGSRKARQFLIDMGRAEALRTIENAAAGATGDGRKRLLSVLRAIGTEPAKTALKRIQDAT